MMLSVNKNSQLDISVASGTQWETALDWGRYEHWNLGKDDIPHFMHLDPKGFFIGRLEGRIVTSVSVVNYTPEQAFLGYYLTDPELRHQGLGSTLFPHAIEYAGMRTIALDAMPAQVGNYEKWGFDTHFVVHRTTGDNRHIASPATSDAMVGITEGIMASVIDIDERYSGYRRPSLLSHWFTGEGRDGRAICSRDGTVEALVGWRKSDDGYRIGPLYAQDDAHVDMLIAAAVNALPEGVNVTIDIPEYATHTQQFAAALGWSTLITTSRMYRGTPPAMEFQGMKGLFSIEVG